ncbi:glycosyltransferase family 2 protein [Paracoccus liaowanqingii]|uniref:Glycosyltransferase family 2 protein n=1 Tax=Paracoccus liaowanqingii TaxID=2560053 RepID=A0A4P7HHL0_9RHOB|nr:glycosyltransferase family 2 protein [Paracoccus liaowanqingii]QBX33515.1 glycosyltransferase family 2 protein [Paracoccus liaowanqingii]
MIRDAFRRFKHRRRLKHALAETEARPAGPGRAHGLPSALIVSVTSHPPRFATLAPTLRSLLRQTVQPDRVILWLAEGDAAHLPPAIQDMAGLEIRTCPDWRSYKKIIPVLLAHPEAHLATADDDVHYPADWLERLVAGLGKGGGIACLRAHRVAMAGPDRPAPYEDWDHNLRAPEAGPAVFPTGVSGVIYAPGVFHPDVTREDLFTRLAPSADDVWLYWMHRMAGSQPRKIGGRARIFEWQGSQAVTLRAANRQGQGNDRAIAALLAQYGWPG